MPQNQTLAVASDPAFIMAELLFKITLKGQFLAIFKYPYNERL